MTATPPDYTTVATLPELSRIVPNLLGCEVYSLDLKAPRTVNYIATPCPDEATARAVMATADKQTVLFFLGKWKNHLSSVAGYFSFSDKRTSAKYNEWCRELALQLHSLGKLDNIAMVNMMEVMTMMDVEETIPPPGSKYRSSYVKLHFIFSSFIKRYRA